MTKKQNPQLWPTLFETVDILLGSRENKTPEQDEKGIMKHLSVFENEFGRYCPELPMKP